MDSPTHEVPVVQPGTSRTRSGAVGCANSRSSYWHLIYPIMSLFSGTPQHRSSSLSFSPSDIQSFLQQLVASSFFQILTISSFRYRLCHHAFILFYTHWSCFLALVTRKCTGFIQLNKRPLVRSRQGRRQLLLQCRWSPGNWSIPATGTP